MLREKNMNTKHIDNKYCYICKGNFKTDNELINQKKLLHTTSVNVTDDDNVYVNGQDCKLLAFKFKTMQNMKAHIYSQHEFKICHKCERIYCSSESFKNHFDQDNPDLDDIDKKLFAQYISEDEEIREK